MKIKLTIVLITVTMLVACGGSSSKTNDSGNTENVVLDTPNPFSDISGVWNSSIVENLNETGQPTLDEIYTVFRSDGSFVVYDYENDAFGSFLNCYTQSSVQQFDHLGDNKFSFTDPENGGAVSSFTLIDMNNISLSNVDGVQNWRREGALVENNLSPICNRSLTR